MIRTEEDRGKKARAVVFHVGAQEKAKLGAEKERKVGQMSLK